MKRFSLALAVALLVLYLLVLYEAAWHLNLLFALAVGALLGSVLNASK